MSAAKEPSERSGIVLRNVLMSEIHLPNRIENVRDTPFRGAFKPMRLEGAQVLESTSPELYDLGGEVDGVDARQRPRRLTSRGCREGLGLAPRYAAIGCANSAGLAVR